MDKKVNAEVLGVLMSLGIEYMNKVPDELMDYITKNCNKEDIPVIDKNTPLNELPISREAQTFITYLNLEYFCENEEQKNEILKRLVENEKKNNI